MVLLYEAHWAHWDKIIFFVWPQHGYEIAKLNLAQR